MTAIFSLATFVFFAAGQPSYTVTPMPNEQACWAFARAFVHKAPETVDPKAVALGAGCVARDGRPS